MPKHTLRAGDSPTVECFRRGYFRRGRHNVKTGRVRVLDLQVRLADETRFTEASIPHVTARLLAEHYYAVKPQNAVPA